MHNNQNQLASHTQVQAKVIGAWKRRQSKVVKHFQTIQTNMFSVFYKKMSIVSEDLIVIGSCFQIVDAATEKARLSVFNLVLGTRSCLETEDLRVLEISETCIGLIKHVSCLVQI